jgi:hypothetical protein
MKRKDGIRAGEKLEGKYAMAKKIKFEDKFFPGHICWCVSFENGKRANPIFGMTKL